MALLHDIRVPLIAVNDTTLTVVALLFKDGDEVQKEDIIMTFETSKTTYDVEAESDGFVKYFCEVDKEYAVNDVVAQLFSDRSDLDIAVQKLTTILPEIKITEEVISATVWTGDTVYSAKALEFIEKNKVDKKLFVGKDFVSQNDIEQLLNISNNNAKSVIYVERIAPQQPVHSEVDTQNVDIQLLTSNKKREINFLQSVQAAGLTSLISVTVETEGIFTFINTTQKYFKNTLLPVIIYETSRLLKKYKVLNGYFTDNAIAFYKDVNIGFAVDIDKGLKVLKIPNASDKTMVAIEEALFSLSNKYLDDILQVEDLTDITFTITDLSAEGVGLFYPLVNKNNSAILGISAIDEKLQRCTLTLTFDHRVTEGKTAANFLKELKHRLESYQFKDGKKELDHLFCFKCLKTMKEDLSGIGFLKCITSQGKEATICQSCVKGF